MTRSARAESLSLIHLSKEAGTICQDRPYLSLSHPHTPGCPPCVSLFQYSSISSWFLHRTTIDMASVNLNAGPPFRPMNSWPLISNITVMTEPFGIPAAAEAEGP